MDTEYNEYFGFTKMRFYYIYHAKKMRVKSQQSNKLEKNIKLFEMK